MKHAAGVDSSDRFEDARVTDLEALLEVAGAPGVHAPRTRVDGVLIGTIVGFAENGSLPLVTYAGQAAPAALPARATLDLHGAHVGRRAVLLFEEGDPLRPIVVGCLRDAETRSLPAMPGQVEVDADGERMIVTAKEQLVLRCGKASITLQRNGKLVVRGIDLVSHAAGTNRIQGASIELN